MHKGPEGVGQDQRVALPDLSGLLALLDGGNQRVERFPGFRTGKW